MCPLLFCSLQFQAHDRAGCRSPCHFAKPGFAECRSQSCPHKSLRNAVVVRFDRVTLDQASTLFPGVCNRSAQQVDADTLSPKRPGYKKAGHRPDRFLVDTCQRARVLQQWIAFSWTDCAPSHGLIVDVSQYARFCAGNDYSPECRSISRPFARLELFAS